MYHWPPQEKMKAIRMAKEISRRTVDYRTSMT
jgi:hypothetical protein